MTRQKKPYFEVYAVRTWSTIIAIASLLLPVLILTAYTITVDKENKRLPNNNSTATNSLILSGLRLHDAHCFRSAEALNLELPLSGLTCLVGRAGVGKTTLVTDGIYSLMNRGLAADYADSRSANVDPHSNVRFDYVNTVVPAVLLNNSPISLGEEENLLGFLGLSRPLARFYAESAQLLTADGVSWVRATPERIISELIANRISRSCEFSEFSEQKSNILIGAFFVRDSFRSAEQIKSFLETYLQAGFRRFMIGSEFLKLSDYSSLPTDVKFEEMFTQLLNEPVLKGISVLVDSLTDASLTQIRLTQSLESAFALSGNLAAIIAFKGAKHTDVQFVADGYLSPDTLAVRPLVTEETFLRILESGSCVASGHVSSDFILGGQTLYEVMKLSLEQLSQFLAEHLSGQSDANSALLGQINFLQESGLGYLCASQKLSSLSSGELRKLTIAFYVAAQLTDTLFIMDHGEKHFPLSDAEFLSSAFSQLCAQGNAVLVTETEGFFSRDANLILEMREDKGTLQLRPVAFSSLPKHSKRSKEAKVKPTKKPAKGSVIAELTLPWEKSARKFSFPERAVSALIGGIGTGKTSVLQSLLAKVQSEDRGATKLATPRYFGHIDEDQYWKSLAVASAFGLEQKLAELFAAQAVARRAGLSSEHFILHHKLAQCAACEGRGHIVTADLGKGELWEKCLQCRGECFVPEALAVSYTGKNIFQALSMPLSEAAITFETQKEISEVLELLIALGLSEARLKNRVTHLAFSEQIKLRVAMIYVLAKSAPGHIFVEGLFCGLGELDVCLCADLMKKCTELGSSVVFTTYNATEAQVADACFELPRRGI